MGFRFVLLLTLILAGEAMAAESFLQVEFLTMNGHTKKIKLPIARAAAASMEATPGVLNEHIEKAKAKYADSLGYSQAIYGKDAWKLVPGLRVRAVKLDDGAGTVLNLRSR
jgi:hypothetical protein